MKEFLAADYKGLVHIRNRIAGGFTLYNVEPGSTEIEYIKARERHGDTFYLAGMAPTEKTLIQGEIYQRASSDPMQCGLYLNYSLVKKPMRDALREQSLEARGVLASQILQHYMDPASWDWINVLLERYPGHVIEFSVYGCNWGTVPNRNCIVWEVRSY